MTSLSQHRSRNNICLDLNEYTVSEFINFIHAYYKIDLPSEFDVYFSGDCKFRFSILVKWIFISLESEHVAMIKLLKMYPSSMRRDLTYAYYKSEKGLFEIDDFQILRDIWKLHTDIKKIEIPAHNVTFKRFAPKPLQMLCLCLTDENSLANLPAHVLKRLKFIREETGSFEGEADSSPDKELGKCFQFVNWKECLGN